MHDAPCLLPEGFSGHLALAKVRALRVLPERYIDLGEQTIGECSKVDTPILFRKLCRMTTPRP